MACDPAIDLLCLLALHSTCGWSFASFHRITGRPALPSGFITTPFPQGLRVHYKAKAETSGLDRHDAQGCAAQQAKPLALS